MFTVSFFKCNRKNVFFLNEKSNDEVGAECTFQKFSEIKQKFNEVYQAIIISTISSHQKISI